MIKPLLQGEAFLRDVAQARSASGRLHLWWLGQSGFLVQWQNTHLLIDPYLSDSLSHKYAATDKPHVRMTERVIEPERLDFIDLVTSSHNHTDHFDPETLEPLRQVNPNLQIVIPEANRAVAAERLAIAPSLFLGLDDGQTTEAAGFRITGIAAAHESIERDAEGRCFYLGYVIQAGPFTLYHSGDTLWYNGLADRLKHWQLDLALLPINGRAPERRVAGNLDPHEAVSLAKSVQARCVIPCHYEMFEFNTAAVDPFIDECRRLDQPHAVLRAGQRWSWPQGPHAPARPTS